ncbi:hypothetical protein N7494_002973, partial [Penicillium frequentans]
WNELVYATLSLLLNTQRLTPESPIEILTRLVSSQFTTKWLACIQKKPQKQSGTLRYCTSESITSLELEADAKIKILLEELKDVYGLEWTTSFIDIDTDEQKKPWFLRPNPNGTKFSLECGFDDASWYLLHSIGRIPVLIDNTGQQPFPVMESSAELLYLMETADKDNHFSFVDGKEQSQMMRWLIFWHASGQPNQGQLNHFGRFAPEQIPLLAWYKHFRANNFIDSIAPADAVESFKTETLRVYNVLELHLSGRLTGEPREYLAGNGRGKFSIADIDAYPWVRAWKRSKISEEEMESYPRLKEWIDRVASRPAVQRGTSEIYDEEVHPELLVSSDSE